MLNGVKSKSMKKNQKCKNLGFWRWFCFFFFRFLLLNRSRQGKVTGRGKQY